MHRPALTETQQALGLRLGRIRKEISDAAERAGRAPDDVTLVAVSKTFPVEVIEEAFAAGQRVFGENRVQEGAEKVSALAGKLPGIRWHLIGHLQTNKVKQAIEAFSLVESVDSLKLAARLDQQAERDGKRLPVLIQVNVAGESSKSGFTIDEARASLPQIARLSNLGIEGLMTIAPLVSDPEEVRWVFRSLRRLRDELRASAGLEELRELSMGMSGDFKVAVEEGATMVRIGRALFGERPAETGAILRA